MVWEDINTAFPASACLADTSTMPHAPLAHNCQQGTSRTGYEAEGQWLLQLDYTRENDEHEGYEDRESGRSDEGAFGDNRLG